MYIPSSYAEERPNVLFDFIDAHPFGVLVTASAEGPYATHLPLVLDRARGARGTLEGHVARANPHLRLAGTEATALVIFAGPDAYVTPSWYPSKAEHGRVVPTWNYVAVHVFGTLRFIEDHAFLRRHLEALTTRSEAGRAAPWAIGDAPPEYIGQLEGAIVGFELEIARIEGKWKMSQNRPADDIDGVARGLERSVDPRERAVGEIVAARKPSRKPRG